MTTLEKIQEVFKKYKESPEKSPELKLSILEMARESILNPVHSTHHQAGIWSTVFAADEYMCRQFNLMNVEIMAEKAYEDNVREPHHALLKMSASLAYVMIQNQETDEWDSEKELIWLKAFSNIPEFKDALAKERNHWSDWRQQIEAQYPKINQALETADTFEIKMPLIYRALNDSEIEILDPQDADIMMVNKIIENFNGFYIQSYIDMHEVKTTSLRQEGANWIFNIETIKVFDNYEKQKFMELLKGQLSDGWGESIEQQTKLIGTQECNVCFDYKNSSLVEPLQNTQQETTKPKMKP